MRPPQRADDRSCPDGSSRPTPLRSFVLRATVSTLLLVVATRLGADGLCAPYNIASKTALNPVAPYLPLMVSVGARSAGPGSEVHVIGDEVIVTREMLGNLIKKPIAIDVNLKSLTIDARRIVLREPLAFADADIRLIAHEIEFEKGGVITLIPGPSRPIRIFAERLAFSDPRYRHFDIRPRKKGDDFADIPTMLQISVNELRMAGAIVSPADAPGFLAKRFTLAPIFDFQPKIDPRLEATGLQEWLAEMKSAEWPEYSVGVWRAGFRVTPFDPAHVAQLKPTLARYDALLSGVARARVLFELRALRTALESGVDADGNGPAFANITPLSNLRREVKKYTIPHAERLAILDSLRELLVSARDKTPVNNRPLLAAATQNIQALADEQRRARFRLADIANEIDAQQLALQSTTDAYKAREAALLQHVEDLKRGAQSRQQLISGLATAVSIVTTAYTGSPQAGALAGGLVIAIGASGAGKNTVQSLAAGYEFFNAVKGPLETSKTALRELDSSRRLYDQFITSFTIGNVTIKEFIEVPVPGPPPTTKKITREEALRELGDKGKAVFTGANDIIKVYKDFSPTVQVPSNVEEDNDLKTLAAEITNGLEKVKKLTLELEALQRSSADLDRRLVAETERSAQLAAVAITNEGERRALLKLVLSLLRDEVARFADTLGTIRRISLLEYREDLPVDPEEIRRLFVAAEVSKSFDPTKILNETDVLNQYIAFIESTQTYVQLLATRVDNAMARQFETYIARRGTGPAIAYISHTYARRLFRETADGHFLGEVNRVLREQFAARKEPARWRAHAEHRIRVPLDLSERVSGSYPLRFIQAAIVGAGGTRMRSANDVMFTLELARVGNFRQRALREAEQSSSAAGPCGCRPGDACYSVDFRAKESRPDQYYWWRDMSLADIRAGNTLLRSPDLSYWFLDPADTSPTSGRSVAVNYPPAEAEMYLRVRLDPNTADVVAPQLSRLTVKLEVFQ
ncbi:MAG: hypothetical protein ACXW4P_04080 [Thermoanaerobaculia bacterium]